MMHSSISLQKALKEVAELARKKKGKEEQTFILEGIRLVEEAIKANVKVKYFFFSPKLLKTPRGEMLYNSLQQQGIICFSLKENELEKIAQTETPQGILAVAYRKGENLEEIINQQDAMLLIIDRVQDPGNMGTILRTAWAAGASGVLSIKGSVDMYNDKVIRSTMGATFFVPVVSGLDSINLLEILKAKGYRIIVTSLQAEKMYFDADYKGRIAIVLGNEANGVSEVWENNADEKVIIPIVGEAESLNVAVTSGIILYEGVKQRKYTS